MKFPRVCMTSESRCPACNPMHGTKITDMYARRKPRAGTNSGGNRRGMVKSAKSCDLCKGAQFVPVEVSLKFVRAYRGGC